MNAAQIRYLKLLSTSAGQRVRGITESETKEEFVANMLPLFSEEDLDDLRATVDVLFDDGELETIKS